MSSNACISASGDASAYFRLCLHHQANAVDIYAWLVWGIREVIGYRYFILFTSVPPQFRNLNSDMTMPVHTLTDSSAQDSMERSNKGIDLRRSYCSDA